MPIVHLITLSIKNVIKYPFKDLLLWKYFCFHLSLPQYRQTVENTRKIDININTQDLVFINISGILMRKFIFILKRKDTEKTSTLLNERNESEEKTLSQHLGLILHGHVRNIKEPRIRKKMYHLFSKGTTRIQTQIQQ